MTAKRWRNPDNKRIRLGSGKRMKDEACCCDPCDALKLCLEVDGSDVAQRDINAAVDDVVDNVCTTCESFNRDYVWSHATWFAVYSTNVCAVVGNLDLGTICGSQWLAQCTISMSTATNLWSVQVELLEFVVTSFISRVLFRETGIAFGELADFCSGTPRSVPRISSSGSTCNFGSATCVLSLL